MFIIDVAALETKMTFKVAAVMEEKMSVFSSKLDIITVKLETQLSVEKKLKLESPTLRR